jgi:hypothetical protein
MTVSTAASRACEQPGGNGAGSSAITRYLIRLLPGVSGLSVYDSSFRAFVTAFLLFTPVIEAAQAARAQIVAVQHLRHRHLNAHRIDLGLRQGCKILVSRFQGG